MTVHGLKDLYTSRGEAGRELARELQAWRGCNPLVLAIARGGVPAAAVIAEALGGELDVVLVSRLRAPSCPGIAVGAVEEGGLAYVAAHAEGAGADLPYLARERLAQLRALHLLRPHYRGSRPKADPARRVTIVVDDGIVTGHTMAAALVAARARRPARLICAAPVAAAGALFELSRLADDVVCLDAPVDFQVLGDFYIDYPPVSHHAAAHVIRRAPLARA